jgi:hypothetical protein
MLWLVMKSDPHLRRAGIAKIIMESSPSVDASRTSACRRRQE